MQYVVFATDKPDSLALRERIRPEHRVFLRSGPDYQVKVVLAGPTLEASARHMNGTMLVIEAESLESVSRFLANDPYARAGLFERVEVRPWNCGLGRIESSVPDPMAGHP